MVKLTEVEDEHFAQEKPMATKNNVLLATDDEDEDYTDTESEISVESDLDVEGETLYERVAALKDIVPPSTRRQISSTVSTLTSFTKSSISFSGKALWILSTSAFLLGVPWALAYAEEEQYVQMEREQGMIKGANEDLFGPFENPWWCENSYLATFSAKKARHTRIEFYLCICCKTKRDFGKVLELVFSSHIPFFFWFAYWAGAIIEKFLFASLPPRFKSSFPFPCCIQAFGLSPPRFPDVFLGSICTCITTYLCSFRVMSIPLCSLMHILKQLLAIQPDLRVLGIIAETKAKLTQALSRVQDGSLYVKAPHRVCRRLC
uniref:Mitochondrial import receptor subunit tom22 homologue, putative n=1 Tax=Aspergillus fumigatus TaxID=746128 RepID=Q6MYU9_ASPFM|nr:mitochondrial import receptor subunit tom22 homologue, putative [Aspergillus fumigatus]